MEEDYEYAPLESNEIRLLEILPGELENRIECRFRYTSLDEVPSYAAVSYTWGTETRDRPIWIDGHKLCITPNLEAALLEFRREAPRIDPVDESEMALDLLARTEMLAHELSGMPQSSQSFDELQIILRDFAEKLDATSDLVGHKELIEDMEAIINDIARRENLLHTVAYAPGLLWIDAICID